MKKVLFITLTMIAACGPSQQDVATVPHKLLDQQDTPPPKETTSETPNAGLDAAVLPEVNADPLEVFGVPPQSNPSGEPIRLTYQPWKVGDVRIRSLASEDYYDRSTTEYRQRTTTQFQQREEVLAANGELITKLQVDSKVGEEQIEMMGTQQAPQPLLRGRYVVVPGSRGVMATHPDGSKVYSREREELSSLLAGVFEAPTLNRFFATRGLQVGETVKLGKEGLKAFSGEDLPVPVYLSLLEADDDTVRFQVNIILKIPEQGFEEVRTQQTIVLERATAHILEAEVKMLRRGVGGKFSHSHTRTVITPIKK